MSFTPSYEFLKRVNELKTEGFPVEINQNTGSATLCEGEYCNKTLKITMYENPYELYLWAFYPDYQLTRSSFARRIYEDTLSKSYKESVNMWGCDGQVLFSDRTPVFALKIDNPSKNIMIYLHVIYELTSHLLKLEAEKKVLLDELKVLEEDNTVPKVDATKLQNLLIQAKNMFESGELSDRKRLVDIFVDCVLVKEDSLEIIFNQAPFVKNAEYAKISHSVPRKQKK